MTVTKEQFAALQVGQVVLVNDKPRVVRAVFYEETSWGSRASVTFAIKRRSWTQRILTVQGYHDLKHKMKILPRWEGDTDNVSRIENDVLDTIGFDVRDQLERELREAKAMAERCGKEEPAAVVKLARRALACAIRKSRRST